MCFLIYMYEYTLHHRHLKFQAMHSLLKITLIKSQLSSMLTSNFLCYLRLKKPEAKYNAESFGLLKRPRFSL